MALVKTICGRQAAKVVGRWLVDGRPMVLQSCRNACGGNWAAIPRLRARNASGHTTCHVQHCTLRAAATILGRCRRWTTLSVGLLLVPSLCGISLTIITGASCLSALAQHRHTHRYIPVREVDTFSTINTGPPDLPVSIGLRENIFYNYDTWRQGSTCHRTDLLTPTSEPTLAVMAATA